MGMRIWVCHQCGCRERFSTKKHQPATAGASFRSHPICKNCIALAGSYVSMMPVTANDHIKSFGLDKPPVAEAPGYVPPDDGSGTAPTLGGDRARRP